MDGINNKMINLNNLTPWDIQTEDTSSTNQNKRDKIETKYKTKGSFNFTRPSTLPHNERSKTPILLEVLEATKESLTAMRRKRFSFDENEEMKMRKKKKYSDLIPVIQNQFPMEAATKKIQKPVDTLVHTTSIECPELQHLETLIESERKCLKLQSMPPLKVKTNHKKKSHSQLTLHNLHYFEPRKTQFNDSAYKTEYNSVNKNILKSLKKKEISPAKKIKTVIAFQTVRIVRFDEEKGKRSPKKAFSKMRVEHFLDSLLDKMK